MSTRIDITVITRSLRQFAKDVMNSNRRAQLEKEADRRTEAEAKRKRDAKVVKEVPWPGAVPEGGITPQLAAYRDTGSVSIGWLDLEYIPGTGQNHKLISGNGSAAVDFMVPDRPAITGLPTLYVPTWSGGWTAWAHFSSFGLYYSGPCWARFRKTTQLDITESSGWIGGSISSSVVLPHPNGLVWAHRLVDNAVRYYYTVRFTGPGTDATPNRGVELIPGALAADPDVLWTEQPENRRLLFQPITPGSVIVSPVTTTNVVESYHSFAVTRSRVLPVTAPGSLTPLFSRMHGDLPSSTPDAFQLQYTTNPAVSIDYVSVPSIEVDGTTYGQVAHERSRLESLPYRWPQVTVPTRNGFTVYPDPDFASAAQLGSLGLCSLSKADYIGRMLNTPYAGTTIMHRLINGDIPPTVPGPYSGSDLNEILAAVAPLPRAFALIAVSGADTEGGYNQESTTMRLPTFAARADNLVADPDFDGFADDVLPSAPGRPPSYTHRLVALEDRVTTTAPIPFVLAATTFGEDAYCRSSMIGLGFTSADLLP